MQLRMTKTQSIDSLMPPVHIKGLIFDLDGTLADTMPIHLKAWKQTGDVYQVTITDKMINDRAGTPTIQVIEELSNLHGWQIDPYHFRLKKNEIYLDVKKKNGQIQPIMPVLEVARKYKDLIPMAIGTGSIKRNAELALQELGVKDWFQALVTADDIEQHKPHPDTFLKCSELIGIPPHECMVYEDGMMGVQAALAAGMSVIHIESFNIFYP